MILWTAEECFLTGTAAEVIPCVEVDHRKIGDGAPGSMTRRLIELFRKVVLTDGVNLRVMNSPSSSRMFYNLAHHMR